MPHECFSNRRPGITFTMPSPCTGDEAWLISESSDGSQHLCKAKAWAPISAMPEMVNG